METSASVAAHIAAPARGRLRGLTFALTASCLWGLSGTVAQVLFDRYGVSAGWMTTVRMLGAALVLLAVVRPPLPPRRWWPRLVLMAVCGLAAVQLTYLGAIALTNVATASFIQYLSIPLIAAYELLFAGRRLTLRRLGSLVAAVCGVSLLVLGGADGRLALSISAAGLAVALLSALTAAFDTLVAVPLLDALGAWRTTSWGMLLGGLAVALWAPPWRLHATGNPVAVALLAGFVVLFGTLAAFGLYFASVRHIGPTDAAIAVTVEPITAAVASLALLHVALQPAQYLGGALILAAVVLLRREG